MTDEFRTRWTYRTPAVTVTYPAGWTGTLPKDRQLAARKAKALVAPKRRRKKSAE